MIPGRYSRIGQPPEIPAFSQQDLSPGNHQSRAAPRAIDGVCAVGTRFPATGSGFQTPRRVSSPTLRDGLGKDGIDYDMRYCWAIRVLDNQVGEVIGYDHTATGNAVFG